MQYLYSKLCHIENEVVLFKNNMMFHRMDEHDHLEAIMLNTRLDTFYELWRDITGIMHSKWGN